LKLENEKNAARIKSRGERQVAETAVETVVYEALEQGYAISRREVVKTETKRNSWGLVFIFIIHQGRDLDRCRERRRHYGTKNKFKKKIYLRDGLKSSFVRPSVLKDWPSAFHQGCLLEKKPGRVFTSKSAQIRSFYFLKTVRIGNMSLNQAREVYSPTTRPPRRRTKKPDLGTWATPLRKNAITTR